MGYKDSRAVAGIGTSANNAAEVTKRQYSIVSSFKDLKLSRNLFEYPGQGGRWSDIVIANDLVSYPILTVELYNAFIDPSSIKFLQMLLWDVNPKALSFLPASVNQPIVFIGSSESQNHCARYSLTHSAD